MVPPASDRVSRARPYSGASSGVRPRVRLRGPNPVPPAFPCRSAPLDGSPPGAPAPGREALQPRGRYRLAPARSTVWPRSPFARRYSGNLDVDFSSSGYLDVSVPRVVPLRTMRSSGGCQDFSWRVRPFGDPRVEGCVPLTADYRSLPRPSSASCAKASAVRPTYLPAHHPRGRRKLANGAPPLSERRDNGCRIPPRPARGARRSDASHFSNFHCSAAAPARASAANI